MIGNSDIKRKKKLDLKKGEKRPSKLPDLFYPVIDLEAKKIKLLFSGIFRTEENRASSQNLRHIILKNLEVPSPGSKL